MRAGTLSTAKRGAIPNVAARNDAATSAGGARSTWARAFSSIMAAAVIFPSSRRAASSAAGARRARSSR
jgi:hypothetical protein